MEGRRNEGKERGRRLTPRPRPITLCRPPLPGVSLAFSFPHFSTPSSVFVSPGPLPFPGLFSLFQPDVLIIFPHSDVLCLIPLPYVSLRLPSSHTFRPSQHRPVTPVSPVSAIFFPFSRSNINLNWWTVVREHKPFTTQ